MHGPMNIKHKLRICNTHYFSTTKMVVLSASMLRYTSIVCLTILLFDVSKKRYYLVLTPSMHTKVSFIKHITLPRVPVADIILLVCTGHAGWLFGGRPTTSPCKHSIFSKSLQIGGHWPEMGRSDIEEKRRSTNLDPKFWRWGL